VPVADEPGDLCFLPGERVGGARAAFAGVFTGGVQFDPGALREGAGADVSEHVVGGAELCADRLHAACTKQRWT
jgi:hypothetical protein